ncbi:MAG: hypothetical protein GYA23_04900 [Methanomicrobiales archaeon]|nr:hypothetical protein [Methanomicrobiales archaeon]
MQSRELLSVLTGLLLASIIAGYLVTGLALAGVPSGLLAQQFRNTGSPAGEPELLHPNRTITLSTPLPESPVTMPSYHVTAVEDIIIPSKDTFRVKRSIPSADEAPQLAGNALASYGGLPPNAVRGRVSPSYLGEYDTRRGITTQESPLYTRVSFDQVIDGLPLMHAGISVDLGENGEFLGMEKIWANLSYAGEIPIIPARDAWEKLKANDMVFRLQGSINDMTVVRVERGYYLDYSRGVYAGETQEHPSCIPVWIFYAEKPGSGAEPFPLIVDATRKSSTG